MVPRVKEMPGQVRESLGLPVASRLAVARQLHGALDHLLLLGRHDEGHDAGEDLLGILGLLVKKCRNLLCRKLKERVQLFDLFLALGQEPSQIAGTHLAEKVVEQLGTASGKILTLQAVQGGEQDLCLPVIDLPDVATRLGVPEFTENTNTVVAVENLVFVGLV